MAQAVKNLPAMWETRVRSLGWEHSLEKGMATYSSILALENPIDRGAWQSTVHKDTMSQTGIKQLGTHSTICIISTPISPFQNILLSYTFLCLFY